ncbi:IS66 family transposase [uncultured Endozoicomonas sp.]|uniref:IS66 family transposase n=1 Tax=uncultured Endozoicomonas sp. TaxID=432652 RepID=UPI00262130FE|nr:IS66 family transposase [uncultured Endozoicomonas sp.]
MTVTTQTLEDLQLKVTQLEAKLAWYEEQFRLSKHQQFGASSERFEGQGVLFNEAETLVEEAADEPEVQQVPAHERKKPVRKTLSDELPRDVVEVDIPDEEKQCDCCGGELKAFGHESSCKLDIVPAQVKVLEIRRLKYACACESGVKTAPVPKMPIPKSISTPGLLAWIITSKYCDALPLYRQEFILKRMGAEISRTTMAEWMIRASNLLLPLYEALCRHLVRQPYIQADETTLQVLKEKDRHPQSKSYMWLYRTGEQLESPIVLYDYQTGRDHQCPLAFLEGFKGFLQCDGHSAYKTLSSKQPDIELVGCMAHARRKFKEALDAHPKKKGDSGQKISRPAQALNMIRQLYAIERRIKYKTTEERYQVRQTESRPIMDKFRRWLEKQKPRILPESKLGKAITYALNQWPYLSRYLGA